MARIIKRFESTCVFCGEKSKAETVQGIKACTTCGGEDPDSVPFYSECDFIRTRAFGDVVEKTVFFQNASKKRKKVGKKPTIKDLTAFLKEVGVEVKEKPKPKKAVLEKMFKSENECFKEKLEEFETFVLGIPKKEEKIHDSPLLSEKEKRVALYHLRRRRVKTQQARYEEEKR